MEQLIATFHIDTPLLIAQVVNFAIVFFILYRFALKPLMKTMDKRSHDIQDGLKNAELSKNALIDAENEKVEIIKDAKKQAIKIIAEGDKKGTIEREQIIARAQVEKTEIIEQAQTVIGENARKAQLQFQKESAEIITSSMEQLFRGYVQKGKGEKIIEEIINQKL